MFRQIYADKEYAPLNLREPRLIIDCGANVGYAAAYFLDRFPTAHLIAVEPDHGNFQMLERNLARFSGRAELIRGGIWSERGQLVTVTYGKGREWSTTVRKATANEESDVTAFDIPSLIPTGHSRISLLKVDIEGSEVELFGNGASNWLPIVDNIAIELHGAKAERVFFEALSTYDYDLITSGELTMCLNVRNTVKTKSAASSA